MSLRTKLLAAVIGLNGAILLLALYLMLPGTEPSSDTVSPSAEAVADLWGVAGALGQALDACDATGCPPEDPPGRRRAQERLNALEDAGWLRDSHVVLERSAGLTQDGHQVWRAETFLAPVSGRPEVADGAERERVVRAFREARQHHNRWVSGEGSLLAVVLPYELSGGGFGGLVATVVPAPDIRSGLRLVYVVMVVGVILLTGVSFALISRLVIRPLALVSDAADRIASGDYRIQIRRRGTNDEFDRTIGAFNRMAREIAEYQGHLEDRVLKALDRMRKAEQHLTIAQRLAATGKLASGIAHEINNPLGGLRNAVRSLARGDLSPEKTAEYLDLVSEGLSRVEETVKKFLSFTPRQAEPRRTDLADVARKAVALATHRIQKRALTLEQDLPEDGSARVFGDPHELQQVTLNLLLNAADAFEKETTGSVRITVRKVGDEVLLEVADTGQGMSPEDQNRCFDMFFTTKDVGEGTGLGLAVVHTIVTNHGGRIEVESAPGEGTAFRVLLPAEHTVRETAPAGG